MTLQALTTLFADGIISDYSFNFIIGITKFHNFEDELDITKFTE